MSYDHQTAPSSTRLPTTRFGFDHVLGSTLLLLAATILLGVATKGTGAGLACDANWPVCDGGLLNLFPSNVPSFFEWIHRVVAMVAGFFVVGTAIAAWRGTVADRRVRWAITLGLVLTPVQVILGRETVLAYELWILNWHFWMAIAIFVLFAAASILVWADRLTMKHVQIALAVAAVAVVLQVIFSPVLILEYTAVLQTTQYAVTLALTFAVLLAAIGGWHRVDPGSRWLLGLTPVLALAVIYFGREAVMAVDGRIEFVYLAISALTLVVLTFAYAETQHEGNPTENG